MGTQLSDVDTGLPVMQVADRPGVCPDCGHKAGPPQDRKPPSRLERFLRLRPVPAMCAEEGGDVTGWGNDPACGCSNAFHGS